MTSIVQFLLEVHLMEVDYAKAMRCYAILGEAMHYLHMMHFISSVSHKMYASMFTELAKFLKKIS